ncbi:MAG: hypothetical protein ABII12_05620 [Planctomycetota bacterium]
MNPRERIMAAIVGLAVATVVLYNLVNFVFIKQCRNADATMAELKAEQVKLNGLNTTKSTLVQRWMKYAGQTLSSDKTQARDIFGKQLKELAKRHGFNNAVFSTSNGTKIGQRTRIETVAHRIGVQGEFDEVMDFLRDIYNTPYLCQVTKLTISAESDKKGGGRDIVKLDFAVETPVLPAIPKSKIPEVAHAEPLRLDSEEPLPPCRDDLLSDDAFVILADRNILRQYEPPPANVVMIDNQDWKTVALRVRFLWDNHVEQEIVKTVASKSAQSVPGKGSIVELEGTYADGVTFGPERFDFSKKKDWKYLVKVHHDPPPPEVVDLAVDNQHDEPVFLDVTFTGLDDQQHVEPTIYLEPGRSDIRQYKDIKTVTVTARYASGTVAPAQAFMPKDAKQTYMVPPEPRAVVSTPEQPVVDPPADPTLIVTGLLTYEGTCEMIAGTSRGRKVIPAGEEGAVDGGTLVGVHPFGGVVRMPTGNFYLYPLGKSFAQRVFLNATDETQLATAIDAWSRQ